MRVRRNNKRGATQASETETPGSHPGAHPRNDHMMATDRATARDADLRTDRADQRADRNRAHLSGAMALQSSRAYEAVPQMFLRLTGSHLTKNQAKPRVGDAAITA
jgi:hypothetical protein